MDVASHGTCFNSSVNHDSSTLGPISFVHGANNKAAILDSMPVMDVAYMLSLEL